MSFEARLVDEAETIIRVDDLSKCYLISHAVERGRYATLRDTLTGGVKSLAGRLLGRSTARPTQEEFWALRDVSFEVKRGEVVGVIGRNGAGKSTLLKILSRITEPTRGRIEIDGRVASLLEVGTGFHPELTGRENIYLNGAILGMNRVEIKQKFDEIVAFAEIEKFLDTPVKRYSSGMYMRLAFAVAAHLEPEILIVDEVLAVGDAAFQKKCLGKMGEVAKGGRTVLFVSHNLSMIQQLCSKGVYLREGTLEKVGPIQELIDQYQTPAGKAALRSGGRTGPVVTSVEVDTRSPSGGLTVTVGFQSSTPFVPVIGIVLCTRHGQPICGTSVRTHPTTAEPKLLTSGQASVVLRDTRFHTGTYAVSVWLNGTDGTVHQHLPHVEVFEYISPTPLPNDYAVDVIGPIQIDAEWQVEGAAAVNDAALEQHPVGWSTR
jgi:lipopolysaccharide transport system ATP-binding protein